MGLMGSRQVRIRTDTCDALPSLDESWLGAKNVDVLEPISAAASQMMASTPQSFPCSARFLDYYFYFYSFPCSIRPPDRIMSQSEALYPIAHKRAFYAAVAVTLRPRTGNVRLVVGDCECWGAPKRGQLSFSIFETKRGGREPAGVTLFLAQGRDTHREIIRESCARA